MRHTPCKCMHANVACRGSYNGNSIYISQAKQARESKQKNKQQASKKAANQQILADATKRKLQTSVDVGPYVPVPKNE